MGLVSGACRRWLAAPIPSPSSPRLSGSGRELRASPKHLGQLAPAALIPCTLVLRSLTSRVATALHFPSRISSPHSGSICIGFPGIGFAPRIPSTQRPRPALRVAYDTAPFPSLFLDTHRYNTVCLSLLAICVKRPRPASLLCSSITESIYPQFVDSALPDLSQCLSSAAPRKTSRRPSGRTTSPTVAHPSLKTSLP